MTAFGSSGCNKLTLALWKGAVSMAMGDIVAFPVCGFSGSSSNRNKDVAGIYKAPYWIGLCLIYKADVSRVPD